MTGPRSRRRRWPFFFFFFLLVSSASPIRRYIRGVQYCNRVCIWMFLVRYIMTGCIFRAPSAIWQGQVLTPPAAPPYPVEKSSAPPPRALNACAWQNDEFPAKRRVRSLPSISAMQAPARPVILPGFWIVTDIDLQWSQFKTEAYIFLVITCSSVLLWFALQLLKPASCLCPHKSILQKERRKRVEIRRWLGTFQHIKIIQKRGA